MTSPKAGLKAQALRGALAGSNAKSRQCRCSLGLSQRSVRLALPGQGGAWLPQNATARRSGTKQVILLSGPGHPALQEGEDRTQLLVLQAEYSITTSRKLFDNEPLWPIMLQLLITKDKPQPLAFMPFPPLLSFQKALVFCVETQCLSHRELSHYSYQGGSSHRATREKVSKNVIHYFVTS